jgi:hypothetical protein
MNRSKLCCGIFLILLLFIGLYANTHIIAFVRGHNIVQSETSPDGDFEAYVEDHPSPDGPNQYLLVQRSDVIHFLIIAHLAEDIDSIQEIHWSPYSDVVLFQTRVYLIATRVPGYHTVKIYLGSEWRRKKPSKQSSFTAGGIKYRVAEVGFPEPGAFSYRFEGSDQFHTIQMDSLVGH